MRREGTGTRYIKARLEESFTGLWSIEAGPVDGVWRTTIEIRSETEAPPTRTAELTPPQAAPTYIK